MKYSFPQQVAPQLRQSQTPHEFWTTFPHNPLLILALYLYKKAPLVEKIGRRPLCISHLLSDQDRVAVNRSRINDPLDT